MSKEENVYYFPPVRKFEDTGFVTHGFRDGSLITARVEPSNDSDGFLIRLIIKDERGDEVCNFSMDKFAALCLIDCINKNLINQEDILNELYYKSKRN